MEREARAPLTLFAIPDQQAETNRNAIEVPLLGSLILTHDLNGVVPGLKDFPRQDRAPVIIPFFAFRIMVGVGPSDAGAGGGGIVAALAQQACMTATGSCKALMWATPLGFIAVVAGWTTTEVGRQPWTVYGVMRTAQSVTPSLTGFDVLLSLAGLYRGLLRHVSRRSAGSCRASCAAASRRKKLTPVGSGPARGARQAGAGSGAMIIFDFVPMWTLILGLAVFFYVLLDGFDLGVGILYNFADTTRGPQSADEFHRPDLGRQ